MIHCGNLAVWIGRLSDVDLVNLYQRRSYNPVSMREIILVQVPMIKSYHYFQFLPTLHVILAPMCSVEGNCRSD
jgi:hypothetical protein